MTDPGNVQPRAVIFWSESAAARSEGPFPGRMRPYHWPMRRGSVVSQLALTALGAAILLAPVSCGPPAITGGFDSPQPAARIFATRRVAAETDPAKIRHAMPGLIQNLTSDDPAVRLLSAEALRELTGETYGYRYFDPEWLRTPAVDRWRDAWERGAITLRDGTRLEPDTLVSTPTNERAAIDR